MCVCIYLQCRRGVRGGVCVFLSGLPSVLLLVSSLRSGHTPSWIDFSCSSLVTFSPDSCSSAPTVITRTFLTHPCACEQHVTSFCFLQKYY